MNEERKRKLAEFEAEIAEEEERWREHEIEYGARIELLHLRLRLLKLGLYTLQEWTEKAKGRWKFRFNDDGIGEVLAWFEVEGVAYLVIGEASSGPIYVEHKAQPGDLYEWTTLDEEGRPREPWMRETPPWSSDS